MSDRPGGTADRSLQLLGVSRRYPTRRGTPDVVAVERVELSVAGGEITAILGASGSGKTTLLRLIAGFEPVDAGRITLAGATLSEPGRTVAPELRGVGMVFQQTALLPHLTIEGNIAFGLHAMPLPERHDRVAELLAMTGLVAEAGRFPHEVSGGQAQRASLARALAPRPALVLLDEPVNNLDASLKWSLLADVRALLKATGTTALFVTHERDEAFAVADQMLVVHRGRVVQAGIPADVYRNPANEMVATYLGATNMLPVQSSAGEVRLQSPFDQLGALTGRRVFDTDNGPVASIRPAEMTIARAAATVTAGGAAGAGAAEAGITTAGLDADVIEVRFMGERWEVTASVGGRRLIAHADPSLPLAAGDRVRLMLRP